MIAAKSENVIRYCSYNFSLLAIVNNFESIVTFLLPIPAIKITLNKGRLDLQ